MSRTAHELAEEALRLAAAAELMIVTAESCTGGLVAAALTDIPGSSRAVAGGYVTYSNTAKTRALGVPGKLIEQHGAVSEQVARAMADGALDASGAGLSVAITGVAGPDGGTETKPVGLVWFAAARRGGDMIVREMRFGDLGRAEIRRRSVLVALEMLSEAAGKTAVG